MQTGEFDRHSISKNGRFTNFSTVPIRDLAASGLSVDASSCRPMVLVVDGEAGVADALVETLNRNGYAAIAAYDGQGALENALLMPPDMVITEVELPGMTGIELANALSGQIPDCRILLLSRLESTSDLLTPASRCGFEFELLSKPIQPSELIARISASLNPQTEDPALRAERKLE